MLKFVATLSLVVTLPLTVACGAEEGDQARLQGTWETTRLVTNDQEVPAAGLRKDVTVTFAGDKMITQRKGKVLSTWTYKLDETKAPKRLTINTAAEGAKERLSYLIYKIEGDTLTTCSGSRSFPQEFTTKTEQGCYFTVRRRLPE